MTRWNILGIAFYGPGGRRRTLEFRPDEVNVVTGASGTGKSAIIAAIDYCLGSSSCGLPFFVREHALAVAVLWAMGDSCLIAGRQIPRAGKGTEQMFVRRGRSLSLPPRMEDLEGLTNRDAARSFIERAFGIANVEDADVKAVAQKGRATVRDIPPYLFLSDDVIISKTTLLHDLNRPDKARDIKATIPFFLGAVDQDSVLAERRLRQLEAALARIERDEKVREISRGRMTERALSLLSRASVLGLASPPASSASENQLVDGLRAVSDAGLSDPGTEPHGDELAEMERARRDLVRGLQAMRERRRALRSALEDATGYGSAISTQSHKLNLARHLRLDEDRCPVCESRSEAGRSAAQQIQASLDIVAKEVTFAERLRPELADEAVRLDADLELKTRRLREVEAQVSAIIEQGEEAAVARSLSQERALAVGRIRQFLDMTVQDTETPRSNVATLQSEIADLRDQVDPEAKRERLRDAEIAIGVHATDLLADLPTEVPAVNARLMFYATPKVTIIEPLRRAALTLAEIGSDQNYLAIHLALSFAIQKHLEEVEAPVPGLLVIDQISRPYYPEGGDEKTLAEMASDSDRSAMRRIVRFLFEETGRRRGLQVILIEHAFIADDSEYVAAVRERWTLSTGSKLIPPDWPSRV